MYSKPNFLIIGVPKAGTTSLYHYLKEHPDVFMPETTELRYFNRNEMLRNLNGPGDSRDRKNICVSWEAYQSYFQQYNGEKAVGECTTSYLFSPEALDEIKKTLGSNVKLIVILREPVSRAFSNYMYYVRRNREQFSFDEAIADEKRRLKEGWNNGWFHISHSLYADKIKYLKNTGIPHKIILFEDFVNDTKNVLKDVFGFLGIDRNFSPKGIRITYNKGGTYKNRLLVNWMLKPSFLRRIIKNLIPHQLTNNFRLQRDKFISNQTQPVEIDPDIALKLKDSFKEDVQKLIEIHPIDIKKWGY